MRGGRGDAQRRAQHSAATTSQPGRFADYVKFDDMFGASCIFTSGDPVQVRREREAYVKDTMERKLYGYVHTLETHGAPITRVVVGGGCESVENRGGFPETRPRSAMAVRDPAAGGDDPFGRKRARVAGAGYGARPSPRAAAPVWNQPSFEGTGGRVPATTTHDGGSLANLFEQSLGEDWEQDPLWAAMDSMGTPGGAGGTSFKNGALAVGGGLDDQQGLVQSGVLRPTATAEDDFERRARIELIEERLHSLEHRVRTAAALGFDNSDGRHVNTSEGGGDRSGGSDKSNAFQATHAASDRAGRGLVTSDVDAPELGAQEHRQTPLTAPNGVGAGLFNSQHGLCVETGRGGDERRDAPTRKARSGGNSGKSSGDGGGNAGRSPQSPSPMHRARPYDPSRSRSQSDERGEGRYDAGSSPRRHGDGTQRNNDLWSDRANHGFAVSGGARRSVEPDFPEVVPGATHGREFNNEFNNRSEENARAGGGFDGTRDDVAARARQHKSVKTHKVSTSFTSTPDPGSTRGVDYRKMRDASYFRPWTGGESPAVAAARLAEENAALSDERFAAKQERDMLLAEQEHNKAQAALLQASNVRYEERVRQLEAMVRANAERERGRGVGCSGGIPANGGLARDEKEKIALADLRFVANTHDTETATTETATTETASPNLRQDEGASDSY